MDYYKNIMFTLLYLRFKCRHIKPFFVGFKVGNLTSNPISAGGSYLFLQISLFFTFWEFFA